jgi:hypothetical protein
MMADLNCRGGGNDGGSQSSRGGGNDGDPSSRGGDDDRSGQDPKYDDWKKEYRFIKEDFWRYDDKGTGDHDDR